MKVPQSCPDLCNPRNSPGQNTGVFVFSRGSSQPRDRTQVSHIASGFFTSWPTKEAQESWSGKPIPSPADLPNPEIKLGSPALQADSLPTELSGKPLGMTGSLFGRQKSLYFIEGRGCANKRSLQSCSDREAGELLRAIHRIPNLSW